MMSWLNNQTRHVGIHLHRFFRIQQLLGKAAVIQYEPVVEYNGYWNVELESSFHRHAIS